MTGAGLSPRPSARSIFSAVLRQLSNGFSAFLPTFLIFAVGYSVLCFVAFQIDSRTIGTMFLSEIQPFDVKTLSPNFWVDFLLVPCWIWWHRFVWFGRKTTVTETVCSRKGMYYAAVTLAVLIISELLLALIDILEHQLGEILFMLLALVVLALVLCLYAAVTPYVVGLAVGFEQNLLTSLQRVWGNLWFCIRVMILIGLPPLVLAAIGFYYLGDITPAVRIWAEALGFASIVLFSSMWVCAQTLIFRWMVDGTLPSEAKQKTQRAE